MEVGRKCFCSGIVAFSILQFSTGHHITVVVPPFVALVSDGRRHWLIIALPRTRVYFGCRHFYSLVLPPFTQGFLFGGGFYFFQGLQWLFGELLARFRSVHIWGDQDGFG
ncbi:unnamed protein product [Citrullus colocynthis]|uniref:Secreted protein n=1 Tax=Citrullus colocynthis TaxID=252529 RepID=A0ABP0Z4H6_9ROSI